ncbi:hypothetical protein LTR53_008381 [Teratosphaeriaceae sp. CCFEE 6253]|nr:hypothetical protein LTR53_008381 [Teratosphaeriaceae sp. CCFEE 6253]
MGTGGNRRRQVAFTTAIDSVAPDLVACPRNLPACRREQHTSPQPSRQAKVVAAQQAILTGVGAWADHTAKTKYPQKLAGHDARADEWTLLQAKGGSSKLGETELALLEWCLLRSRDKAVNDRRLEVGGSPKSRKGAA